MNCLEVYRRKLVREINKEFRSILHKPGEDPVHDFRVGVKRLTAFYYFLQSVNPDIRAKKILKPYRGLFKAIGNVRDLHIAENLAEEFNISKIDLNKLRSTEKSHFRNFKNKVIERKISGIKVPTVPALGLSNKEIHDTKGPYLDRLQLKITVLEKRMTQKAWHRKRILLKRYHHTLDAFHYCPGHELGEEELKQIRMLEQLLGDWHDRVISYTIVDKALPTAEKVGLFLKELKRQEKNLLETAKIYLKKYVYWHSVL